MSQLAAGLGRHPPCVVGGTGWRRQRCESLLRRAVPRGRTAGPHLGSGPARTGRHRGDEPRAAACRGGGLRQCTVHGGGGAHHHRARRPAPPRSSGSVRAARDPARTSAGPCGAAARHARRSAAGAGALARAWRTARARTAGPALQRTRRPGTGQQQAGRRCRCRMGAQGAGALRWLGGRTVDAAAVSAMPARSPPMRTAAPPRRCCSTISPRKCWPSCHRSCATSLLRCSILDELDPALCEAVAENADARELLRELYRRNLFVTAHR